MLPILMFVLGGFRIRLHGGISRIPHKAAVCLESGKNPALFAETLDKDTVHFSQYSLQSFVRSIKPYSIR